VSITARSAAQDGWNPHQERSRQKKAAKHGKMTKHGHFAEIASRQCFCRSVFTQPRPRTDIGTTGVIHRAAGQLGQTDCHPENLLRTEWDRRTCAVGPEAEITVIRIDNIVQP